MLWAVHSGCSNGIWMPWSGLRLPASDMLTLKTWRVQMLQNNSRAFDLSTFSVRRPSPIHSYSLPASVCLTLSPHTQTHTQTQPSTLCLCLAHMKCRTWNMLFCPLAMREGRRENLHMCVCMFVCGVGVENVFWQVSLMRSFYEICKPGNPTPSPPATPPHLRLPLNQVWGLLLKLQLSRLHRHELSLWINGHIDGVSRVWECESRRTWKMKEDVINLQ